MGIRGLTTYIMQRSDIYFENYELSDTYLIIDGCSLSAQLYQKCTKANDCFGGDYDKFRSTLISFFNNIHECNIKPLIILDGGYEYRKLDTLYTRMDNRIETCKNLNPSNQGYYQLNPLFQMEVFKETCRKMGIQFIICDFEADFQVASISRHMNCPILSLDSDFFIYDCLYIPINTLDLKVYKKQNKSYLKCKLFKVEKLLSRFDNMDKSLLPLIATLLGNDYVKKSTFQRFFSQLKIPHTHFKTNNQQRHIKAVLSWLGSQSFESATERILGMIPQHLRYKVHKIITESVDGYKCSPEYILKYFELLPSDSENYRLHSENYLLIDDSDKNKRQYRVPIWFIEKYRCGIFTSSFINLITKQTQLFNPQMEDISLPHSFHIALPILQVLFGLLTSPKKYKYLSYITRTDSGLKVRLMKIEPVYHIDGICEFPPLDQLPNTSKQIRDSIFFFALKMEVSDLDVLNQFPEDWKLIVISIVYWIRSVQDVQITKSHLVAFLLCILQIKCIDNVIGFHRSEKIFADKFKNEIKIFDQNYNKNNTIKSVNEDNLINLIQNINQIDAIFTTHLLLPNFNVNQKLFTNPKKFSVRIVHCFAEFQAAYRQIDYLNNLLDHLFLPASTADFYNGTFIYNVFTNLKKRNDAVVYLNTILQPAPSVLNVLNKTINLFYNLTPALFE